MSRQRVTVMATGRLHEWQVRYWCPTCAAWQDYGQPVEGVTVDVASVQAVVRQCERALSHKHPTDLDRVRAEHAIWFRTA